MDVRKCLTITNMYVDRHINVLHYSTIVPAYVTTQTLEKTDLNYDAGNFK